MQYPTSCCEIFELNLKNKITKVIVCHQNSKIKNEWKKTQ
jgi:hypothetical protein